MASVQPPGRAPLQKRSERSRDRMLDAAEVLIREHGFEALTIADVVRRARTSVGSFYNRFEDRAGLLRAVQDVVLTRIEAMFEAQSRELAECSSLAEAVSKIVTSFVTLVRRDVGLVRAFAAQSLIDATMWSRTQRYVACHFKYFADALRIHRAEIRHPDTERAIRYAFGTYLTLSTSIGWGEPSPTMLPVPEAISELTRTVTAYLEYEPAPKSRARRKR